MKRKMSKTKFSKEKHIETGAALTRLRDEMTVLMSEAQRAYGTQSKAAKAAGRALDGLDRLRSALDDELARETPRGEWDAEHLARVYFGAKAP